MHPLLRSLSLVVFALISSAACWGAVPDDPRHRSQRKEKPSAGEIEQEREWIAVDKTSAAALQAHLDKKPRGSRHKEATLLPPIAAKFEAILAGEVKPVVVISPAKASAPFDGVAVEGDGLLERTNQAALDGVRRLPG